VGLISVNFGRFFRKKMRLKAEKMHPKAEKNAPKRRNSAQSGRTENVACASYTKNVVGDE
jgi:hypothetical protein